MPVYDPTNDSDKMRALFQLASSIADQLANVASSLTTEAEMLASPDAFQNIGTIAKLIKHTARRTDMIVESLLLCSGKCPASPRVLNVAKVFAELTSMFQRMLGETITLTIVCPETVLPVYADLNQFERIFCTLVARARDAIPDNGWLSIRVANLTRADQPALDRDYVSIEIADSGLDILSLESVFEPVLVRKSYGVWLGLAVVYGAVCQMGGRITVETDSSRGSKFTILLPAVRQG
jgi:signal transduction histidine kinase